MDKDEYLFQSDNVFDSNRRYVFTYRKFKPATVKNPGDTSLWYLQALNDGSYYISNYPENQQLMSSKIVIRNGYSVAFAWQGDNNVFEDLSNAGKNTWIIKKSVYPLLQ